MTRDVPPAEDDRRPNSPTRRIDTASNLLLGLLALQNNFIDRDALLGAFNSWVVDRSRGLGRILLDRGALSPSRHMLLEALVEEHIRMHGDDPEKSLAALSSIGSVRDDLSRVADPDVQETLAHVSTARRIGTMIRTGLLPGPPWASQRPPVPDSASSALMPGEGWARSSWPWTPS